AAARRRSHRPDGARDHGDDRREKHAAAGRAGRLRGERPLAPLLRGDRTRLAARAGVVEIAAGTVARAARRPSYAHHEVVLLSGIRTNASPDEAGQQAAAQFVADLPLV